MREESRSGLEIVLVDIWEGTEPRPEVERFCEMWGIKGPILLDPGLELAGALGIRGVPTNVVVDSDGLTPDGVIARIVGLAVQRGAQPVQ